MSMRRTIPCIAVLLTTVGLGACGSGRPIKYYTMEVPTAPQPSTGIFPVTLLVGRITAPEILRDAPIAYRSGPNEIGTYNYHYWVEPPEVMVKLALIRELRSSGRFQSVAEVGSEAQGEFVLQGRLYDFEEVDAGNISALVTMEFHLLDRKDGRIVWTHFYSHSEPVPGKEVPDVVTALDRNLDRGLTEVSAGLDTYFSSLPPAKS
ncbi:MAG TPA: ABC-type transport auxiliary lipoprotein family protein [Terriglobia bacterium]|nr:ABC-type transport auxiliary lipoprotein family protein [Terriglobia bacterium]